MVEGEGALEEGVSGKGDEAEAVVGEAVGEIGDGELGPLEAARFDVFGEHAFGAIDGEEDVEAGAAFFAPVVEKVGAGHGDEEKRHGGDEEQALEQPPGGRDAGGERGNEVGGGEEADGLPAAALGADFQEDDGEDGEEADGEPDGGEKAGIEPVPEFGDHGSLLQRVWERAISRPMKRMPG
jgi:hypothetical protein